MLFWLAAGVLFVPEESNLVPESTTGFNVKEQLSRGDVQFRDKLILVDIKWSKTLQYRQRELLLPLLSAKNKQVCPVFWMKFIFGRFPAPNHAPLLSYPKNGKMVPVTYDQLGSKLKEWVKKAGYASDEGFTLHGLRRGGTNHAMTTGMSGEEIRLMGDWASDAYMTYLDLSLDKRVTNMVRFIDEMDKEVEECLIHDAVDSWDIL